MKKNKLIMKQNKAGSIVGSASVKPVVVLDACSEKYSQKVTAKNINKTVKGHLKLLRNVSFG